MNAEKPEPVPDTVCSRKHVGFRKKNDKSNIPIGDTDSSRAYCSV